MTEFTLYIFAKVFELPYSPGSSERHLLNFFNDYTINEQCGQFTQIQNIKRLVGRGLAPAFLVARLYLTTIIYAI